MANEDWKVVTLKKELKKKPTTEHGLHKAKELGQVETLKKFDGGVNKKAAPAVSNVQKLDDNESADFKHQEIPQEFKIALQKARQAKGWKQSDLAHKLNAKPSIIQDYETGKAIPNPQIISQLNRVLGVTLPKIPKKKAAVADD